MLINGIFFVLIAAIYYLFIKYAFWTVAPFFIALLIAIILQKPIRFISKKTKIKKGVVGAVAVILIIVILLSAMVLVGYRVVVEFRGFGEYIVHKLNDLPGLIKTAEAWILGKITLLPDGLEKTASAAVSEFADKLLIATKEEESVLSSSAVGFGGVDLGSVDLSMLATPLGGLWSTAKRIPSVLIAALIGVIACFFITCDYDKYVALMKQMLSKKHSDAIIKTKKLLSDIIGKMLKSYIMIMFITFCEISIGLNIMKLAGIYEGGYILAIAMGTAILDILPVFGTGAVVIPWMIYNFITGNNAMGIGLLVLYIIITVIRQILEPRLVAMNVGVPPLVTLAGMYLGLQLFGAIGIIIVPVTFVLIKALNAEGMIHLWNNNSADDEGSEKEANKPCEEKTEEAAQPAKQ